MRSKMTSLILIGILSLLAQSATGKGPSGHRAALLLGNSEYDGFTLNGVHQSLDEVEQALASQGYRITRHENLNQKDFKSVTEDFTRSVPTNGVALVYHIGLGAHVERLGKWYNLLRPVGEKIENDNDYRSRGQDVQELIEILREQSGSRVNLVFLDACWESPVKPENEKVFGGLREFEVGPDTTVMFATGSGQMLSVPDGNRVSAFSQSLARHLGKLDESVQQACQAMAADVEDPWYTGVKETGIGPPSPFTVADKVREGKQPGEGFVNSIGMTFRWCPPGSFTMGSEQTGNAATRDRQPVQVTLSKGFWMGEHEVTQREYDVVKHKSVPNTFTVHKNAPFWGVSEAKHVTEFCEKLNELERQAGRLPSGWEYQCPTEAEWEYACRAGSASAYCFGDSVSELGEYGNLADRTLATTNPNYHWAELGTDDGVAEALAPVGSFRPNAWGIRDMHGNVYELVADHLVAERPGGNDPLVRLEKNGQTQIRGGAWCSLPLYCESSFRNTVAGRDKYDFIGFRVVLKRVK